MVLKAPRFLILSHPSLTSLRASPLVLSAAVATVLSPISRFNTSDFPEQHINHVPPLLENLQWVSLASRIRWKFLNTLTRPFIPWNIFPAPPVPSTYTSVSRDLYALLFTHSSIY